MKHDWEYKKLGEVAFFESGSRPVGGVRGISNGVLSLGGEHIGRNGHIDLSTPKYVSQDYYTNNPKGHITKGDILLCKDGALTGKVALLYDELNGYDAMVNEHVFIIRTSMLFQPYLFRYLFSDFGQYELKARIKGAAQGGLNGSNLRTIPIPVPPLPIQEQIVAELDKVSEIIEKKKQQVKELDNLAQSIFYDMFGDPVENEKGWEVKLWKSFGKITNGFAFNSKLFRSDGIPVLKIGNINTGTLRLENVSYYDYSNNLIKYEVYPNDIVLSLTGTAGKDDYGNVCIIPDNGISKYYLNQRNAKLDSNGVLLNLLIKHIFANPHFKKDLTKGSNGIRQGNILNKDIENLRIPIPPLSLQQSFAQKIEAIEKQKELITASIKEAQTLFDARMDYWFGE